jgi:hypothetical protein
MSTTDKAKELFDKVEKAFDDLEVDSEPGCGGWIDTSSKRQAIKKCSLISVDEILSLNCESFDTEPNPHHYYSKTFWNDVKEKIKQL